MIADRSKLIGCYQQLISRLFIGSGVYNWLPAASQSQCFDITDSNFEEAFHLGLRSLTMLWQFRILISNL